jgi:hypothetical protein
MLQIISAKVNTFPVLHHPNHSLSREVPDQGKSHCPSTTLRDAPPAALVAGRRAPIGGARGALWRRENGGGSA